MDVLEKLAQNESGAASAFAGAGLGLGAGLNLGNQFANMTQGSSSGKRDDNPVDRLKFLKELLEANAILRKIMKIKKNLSLRNYD